MSDRSHRLPCLPDILLDSRYQKEWVAGSGTSFGPSSTWCLYTANGIFHVRLDSSSRSPLDSQLDWCGHLGHLQLSHIPMPVRIPSTFLPQIRGIPIRSKRPISIYVCRSLCPIFEAHVHQFGDRWRCQPSGWFVMSRYSWNVLPLEIRCMAEVEEHFRDDLDLKSNVYGWSR
jgi:hypothetical protein